MRPYRSATLINMYIKSPLSLVLNHPTTSWFSLFFGSQTGASSLSSARQTLPIGQQLEVSIDAEQKNKTANPPSCLNVLNVEFSTMISRPIDQFPQ
jgi:hypothetical protein